MKNLLMSLRVKWDAIPYERKLALVVLLVVCLVMSFSSFAHNEGNHAAPTSFDGYTVLASPDKTHMVACAPDTQDNGLHLCYPFRVSPMNVVEIGDHGWCRLEEGGAECAREAEELLK